MSSEGVAAVESAVRPRVIVGVGGRGARRRVVDTAVSLARGTGAVLYAVDVRRGDGTSSRCGAPAMQNAYHALAQASAPVDDVDVRIVVTTGDPDETLLRLADRPGDLLVLGHSRRAPTRGAERPLALRCAARARCSVVVVPCEQPQVEA
ncbi:universal stress protein [Pseudonocardia halophobica]|uniref:universal stress protein n=1 Tax=Pseudonocardia halophobica TaxID=29401 RepID=UPI003D8D7CED